MWVGTVIFAGPEGLSPRLLSITGGFWADVGKQVYIGGSDENNNGVTIVKFGWPGIENFPENGLRVQLRRRLFSLAGLKEPQGSVFREAGSFEIACLLRLLQLQSCEKLLLQAGFFREAGAF